MLEWRPDIMRGEQGREAPGRRPAGRCRAPGLVFVCVLVSCLVTAARADSVVLKSGKVFEGRIVSYTDDEVGLEIPGKGVLTFGRAEVGEVEFAKPAGFDEGLNALKEKQYDDAVVQFQKVIAAQAGSSWAARAHLGLGECYTAREKWGSAAKAYKRSLEFKLDSGQARDAEMGLAVALYRLGKHKDAITSFQRLGALVYEKGATKAERAAAAPSHYYLGQILSGQDKHEEALMAYLRVVVLCYDQAPWVAMAMLGSADMYREMGDVERARRTYGEVNERYRGTDQARQARKQLAALDR